MQNVKAYKHAAKSANESHGVNCTEDIRASVVQKIIGTNMT